jgi:hypothetical protein
MFHQDGSPPSIRYPASKITDPISDLLKEAEMDIQHDTKLYDLLTAYPALEQKIMQIAPPFRNLKNPVLRNTVAKLATLEKVARVGNLDVTEFLNTLRKETGQPELTSGTNNVGEWQADDPDWIKQEPAAVVDGTGMLNRGEHPLGRINALIREIKPGHIILLRTNFKPIPMIEEMARQKHQVFSKTMAEKPDQHLTFIRRTHETGE